MNKIEIEVPRDIRYISEWIDFPLQQLSTGHCIVNKTITGCGYTHFCLTNNQNVILCSPRKFLLENKHEQHPKDTFLIINNGEKVLNVDGNSVSPSKRLSRILSEDELCRETFDEILNIKRDLSNYVLDCQTSCKPIKILVTYDSLHHIVDLLSNNDFLGSFLIVVDEFQNIFMDSRFKAETELNFIDVLQSCPNVTYLSATPYIEEYLDELDEFKDLPYYELKWDSSKLRKIDIDYKKAISISKEVDKIICNYLSARFPQKITEDKVIHESREVVFYVNSVKMIGSIIKRNKLSPDQVNIICSNTKSNQESLGKIGHSIGKAPLKGEPHKMFTFCTRTTYSGADFYSTNALSVIVSDCKIDSLSTDIRMDFPQIMGRQRLKENVFRDECIFIFSLADNTITMEQFDEISKNKLSRSSLDLKNFSLILDSNPEGASIILSDIRVRIKTFGYKQDYTGINTKSGSLVVNKLVLLSERRAFELRSGVYRDIISVYNELESISDNVDLGLTSNLSFDIEETKKSFEASGRFVDKMKTICSLILDKQRGRISVSDISWIPRNYRNYLNYLGPEKIRALKYEELELKKAMNDLQSNDLVKNEFLKIFLIGEKYLLKDVKDIVKKIYINLNITKTPKATDLELYFNVKNCLIYNSETKKQSRGYEILSLK